MKKKALMAVLVIIVAIGIYRVAKFAVSYTWGPPSGEEAREIPVKAVAAEKTDITDKLRLGGNIVGIEVVNVFSHVPGKIHNVLAKEGQKVESGAVLFQVNRDVVGMDYKLAAVQSPISGFIGKITADRGMTISPAVPLAEVVNMSLVEAVVRIMEDNIARVQIGMEAVVRIGAYPDEIFRGTVYKKSAVLDLFSRTQDVRIRIDNRHLKLKHGMYAEVDIILGSIKGAVVIPADAVFQSIKGMESVYKVVDGKASLIAVETGVSVDDLIEVRSGLKSGDLVVILGHDHISDGDSLVVYIDDERKESEKAAVKAGEVLQ